MRVFIALLVVLTFPALATAGEKGKLVSILADYADLKQRVLEIREARKGGYSSDSKELIDLRKEIYAASRDVQEYMEQLSTKRKPDNDFDVPLALEYAYDAMLRLVSMELDRNLYRSNVALSLLDKYADIWLTIDPIIPVFSAR